MSDNDGGFLVPKYIFRQIESPGIRAKAWRFVAWRLLNLSTYIKHVSMRCANKGHGLERHAFASKIIERAKSASEKALK